MAEETISYILANIELLTGHFVADPNRTHKHGIGLELRIAGHDIIVVFGLVPLVQRRNNGHKIVTLMGIIVLQNHTWVDCFIVCDLHIRHCGKLTCFVMIAGTSGSLVDRSRFLVVARMHVVTTAKMGASLPRERDAELGNPSPFPLDWDDKVDLTRASVSSNWSNDGPRSAQGFSSSP